MSALGTSQAGVLPLSTNDGEDVGALGHALVASAQPLSRTERMICFRAMLSG